LEPQSQPSQNRDSLATVEKLNGAALQGDVDGVKQICQSNPALGSALFNGVPILQFSFAYGDPNVSWALVEHCDVPFSYTDNHKNNIVIIAIKTLTDNKFEKVAEELVKRTSSSILEHKNDEGESARLFGFS
jgi:hypothetical protein